MDKPRAAAIAAVAARGEQIKTNSAEYLWVCCGIQPPLLSDRPIAQPVSMISNCKCRPACSTAPAVLTRK